MAKEINCYASHPGLISNCDMLSPCELICLYKELFHVDGAKCNSWVTLMKFIHPSHGRLAKNCLHKFAVETPRVDYKSSNKQKNNMSPEI